MNTSARSTHIEMINTASKQNYSAAQESSCNKERGERNVPAFWLLSFPSLIEGWLYERHGTNSSAPLLNVHFHFPEGWISPLSTVEAT
jgi:hypothetical protein